MVLAQRLFGRQVNLAKSLPVAAVAKPEACFVASFNVFFPSEWDDLNLV
jgi:hypothetical protein